MDLECQRDMMCHKGGPYEYISEDTGICTKFFSIEDGESNFFYIIL